MWDNVLGHLAQKQFLQNYLRAGERPHALLFCGASGLGKELLAMEFAKSLLCLNHAEADACESCRLFNLQDNSFAHPDFIRIGIEDGYKSIRIEQIKELISKTAFAPVLSETKVCLIRDADKLTIDAANSLLKLLEEPPAGWVLIMLAQAEDKLLPTILSRVVSLRFQPVDEALVMEVLAKEDVPEEKACVLSRFAEGSVGEALRLWKQDVFEYRVQAKAFLEALPLAAPFSYLAGRTWLEKYERPEAVLFVRLLQLFLRDMLFIKLEAGARLYNIDVADELVNESRTWGITGLKEALEAVDEAYRALESNVGIKLTLEAMALKIDNAYKRRSDGYADSCRYQIQKGM